MRNTVIALLISAIIAPLCWGKETIRPVSTYSIVAVDKETGQLGVAVQSHWFKDRILENRS